MRRKKHLSLHKKDIKMVGCLNINVYVYLKYYAL